jgi:hypothetical protein
LLIPKINVTGRPYKKTTAGAADSDAHLHAELKGNARNALCAEPGCFKSGIGIVFHGRGADWRPVRSFSRFGS